jgi:hypothetical protein
MIQLHQYLAGFNHSAWNSLVALTPIWVPVVGMTVYSFIWRKEIYYHFDSKYYLARRPKLASGQEKGAERIDKPSDEMSFKDHSVRYSDLGKLIVTLSAGAIAFLVNALVNAKASDNQAAHRLVDVCPIVVGIFGCSIAFIVIFSALQAFWYEEYCYRPNHDSYKAWKYALCTGLGVDGGLAFLIGFGWLAANLF